jgi:hypothetical protein
MRAMAAASFLVVLTVSCSDRAARTDGAEPGGLHTQLAIEPDDGVQSRLEHASDLIIRRASVAERCESIAALAELARDDEKFLRQLVYFYCRHETGRHSEDKQIFVLYLIGELKLSQTALTRVVTPYLFHENERLDSIARNFLAKIEGSAVELACDRRDYQWYTPLIGGADPPLRLIRYMFDHGPESALLEMNVAYHARENREAYRRILWAEHVISDNVWKQQHGFLKEDEVEPAAAAEIENLSAHEAWWARLYVAEILVQQPEFQTPELMERLRDEPHELVRLAISRKARQGNGPPSEP